MIVSQKSNFRWKFRVVLRPAHLSACCLLLSVAGCLPSTCQHQEPRALFPADSLSRSIAETIPIDTLRLIWETSGSGTEGMEFPRTVRFGMNGLIYVSDVKKNLLFAFEKGGALQGVFGSETFGFPYIAGVRSDTLLLFNPESRHIDFVVDGKVSHSFQIPGEIAERQPLQYVTTSGKAIYFKSIGDDFQGYISRMNDSGTAEERFPLEGRTWRHAGMLRMWGDSLISLCAYRPFMHIILPSGKMDSLQLVGFDSPMLARSRAFALGEIDNPPLLSASAAPHGDDLFVLNMRAGWLRVDVFDQTGQLKHRLVQENPSFNEDFYPIDLDARTTPDGTRELAIVIAEPEPKLSLYEWQGGD